MKMDCPRCGYKIMEGLTTCLQCGANIKDRWVSTEFKASFIKRAAAMLIDGAILALPMFLIFKFVAGGFKGFILCYLLFVVYNTVFEVIKLQPTVGKLIMKIMVTDMSGTHLTLGASLKRNFFKLISALTLIGFFLAIFTENKQAMHDLAAKSLVIAKQ